MPGSPLEHICRMMQTVREGVRLLAGENVRLLVPFEALLDSVAGLSLEDKILLREALDEQIEIAAEENPAIGADIREARDAHERGDYVTIDDYVEQRRKGT